MVVYMQVTKDEYELPVAIADTVAELAMLTGIKPNSISTSISKAKKYKRKSQYVKIEIDEGDEDGF